MRLNDNKADVRVILIIFRDKDKMELSFICLFKYYQKVKLKKEKLDRAEVNPIVIQIYLSHKVVFNGLGIL